MTFSKKFAPGLTMIELLIVITLLAIFATITMVSLTQTQKRGNDAQRKRDLQEIRTAFEDYYNDNSCYPPVDALQQCNSTTALAPYLHSVKCDPSSKQPYDYVPLADRCQGYRVYTQLQVGDDSDIAKVGCDMSTGCGYPAHPEYNYGVAVGTSVFYSE